VKGPPIIEASTRNTLSILIYYTVPPLVLDCNRSLQALDHHKSRCQQTLKTIGHKSLWQFPSLSHQSQLSSPVLLAWRAIQGKCSIFMSDLATCPRQRHVGVIRSSSCHTKIGDGKMLSLNWLRMFARSVIRSRTFGQRDETTKSAMENFFFVQHGFALQKNASVW